MLILMRKRGEAVDIIDRDSNTVLATVTVLEVVSGNNVRLGFDAPQHIKIIRDNAVRRDEDGSETESEGSAG